MVLFVKRVSAMKTKTDNGDFNAKLALRKYFLDKYEHKNVFDACQGSGKIWSILRKTYAIDQYFGVDVKPKKGRLKVDSFRILNQPGWSFDVIDIDTYGSPWKHFKAVIDFKPSHPITLFLTDGLVKMGGGGTVDSLVYQWTGLDKMTKIQPSIVSKIYRNLLPYCLDYVRQKGFKIFEAQQAITKNKTAQYYGLHVE